MAEPSTNPFRKKGPAAAALADSGEIPQVSSPAAFLQSLSSTPDSVSSRDPPTQTKTKSKVVKRVRVQSPPPRSPDSPVEQSYQSEPAFDNAPDQFENRFPENPDHIPNMPEAAPLVAANRGSEDPFNQNLSLQEIETDKEASTTASASGKGAMDVNAFQRLLLTGQSPVEAVTPATAKPSSSAEHPRAYGDDPVEEAAYVKDAMDADAPQPQNDTIGSSKMEASSGSQEPKPKPTAGQKKAPPPPSSRHGKLINSQNKEDTTTSRPSSSSSSKSSAMGQTGPDAHKPLPQPIQPMAEEERTHTSAANKLPGLTASGSLGAASAPVSSKKSTPAPPPRRGHSRANSKAAAAAQTSIAEDLHPRGSLDSQRSDSFTQAPKPAPAPPPPRRPGALQRPPSAISPTLTSSGLLPGDTPRNPLEVSGEQLRSSFDSTSSKDQTATGQPKSSRPPPPPARNASVRRTAPKDASRHISGAKDKENAGLPPPPPPRARGSSKGSMDNSSFGAEVTEEPLDDTGKGADILADLTALQREVDAMRGQYGSG